MSEQYKGVHHFVIMFDGRCMGLSPDAHSAARQVEMYNRVVSDVYKARMSERGNPQAFSERVPGPVPLDYMGACYAHEKRLAGDARGQGAVTLELSTLEVGALKDAMMLVQEEPLFDDAPTQTMTCVLGSVPESGFFVPVRGVG